MCVCLCIFMIPLVHIIMNERIAVYDCVLVLMHIIISS